MIAIILVFLEVFKHFRRDLTLAKEAFETAKGTSVMLFQFLFLLSYFIFFLKKTTFHDMLQQPTELLPSIEVM